MPTPTKTLVVLSTNTPEATATPSLPTSTATLSITNTPIPAGTPTREYYPFLADPAQYCEPVGKRVCIDIENDSQEEILAHALVSEACSLGPQGMANVAQAIRNRMANPNLYSENPVSQVTRYAATPEYLPRDFTFVGLTEPIDRESDCWVQALILANQLLQETDLTPAPNQAIMDSNIVYYCAIGENAFNSLQLGTNYVYYDYVLGTYQIFRTYSMGKCK